MRKNSDPRHTNQFTTEWLKKKRINVLQSHSQNPDFSLTEILSWDLKRTVDKLNELKQNHKKEWSKIPPQQCGRLVVIKKTITPSYCC